MQLMRKAALLTAVAGLAACGGVKPRLVDGRVPDVINETPERRGYFEAIGIGAADPTLPTATQRRSLARDAAIVKAQYELLSYLKGVELIGGHKVSRAVSVDSSLETKIKQSIRGAQVLKSEFTDDGGCVVTLRLPKDRFAQDTGLEPLQ